MQCYAEFESADTNSFHQANYRHHSGRLPFNQRLHSYAQHGSPLRKAGLQRGCCILLQFAARFGCPSHTFARAGTCVGNDQDVVALLRQDKLVFFNMSTIPFLSSCLQHLGHMYRKRVVAEWMTEVPDDLSQVPVQ